MKKWLIPLVGLVLVAGATTAAVTLAVGGSGPTSGDDVGAEECSQVHNVEACDDAGRSGAGTSAPVCAPETPDCQDTIVVPDGDATGPDQPVASDGAPVTSGDGIAPDECSLVHNIDACQGQPPGN